MATFTSNSPEETSRFAAGIAHRVVFASGSLGPATMAAFDVFALPSAYEGMPYVALEAARAGLPIVATDVGGIRSIVLPERNGFIVENWDARQFAHSLTRLLESKELRLRMGRESAEIGKAFTVEKMVRETLQVYDKAIWSRRSHRTRPALETDAG
jgi:glycosyltransferase involved in cell wall biosynthesis